MRDAGFHSRRAAKKGDELAPSQLIDPQVPTGFEDRILLKLANRGRGVLGLLRSALADPGMSRDFFDNIDPIGLSRVFDGQ
jgi:hypothetical protein